MGEEYGTEAGDAATRAVVEGPYELSLVEGSITTPEDIKRIHEIRAQSGTLVTIGACICQRGSGPCTCVTCVPSA